MRLPTARESFECARGFAAALGCNVIPTTVRDRMPLVKWAHLHAPGSPRVTVGGVLDSWGADAEDDERHGEATAWALLPGSGRLAVIDVDQPDALAGIIERHGETPLVVRSPTQGRAHLYYRWPHGTDVGSVGEASLGGAYGLKARGATIHAPGSIHKSGRGWYWASIPRSEWTRDLVGRLPFLDLAALAADRVGRLDLDRWAGAAESIADDEEGERRGRAWLERSEHMPGSREGKTWRAAMSLGDLGCRLEVALALVIEWDAHGHMPRGAADVGETVRRAYAGRRNPIGCRRFGDGGEDIDADALLADLLAA